MKKTIAVIDDDVTYSKKFCNQAIKLYGKKYLFLSFKNIQQVHDYVVDNKVEVLIISNNLSEKVTDVKVNYYYILTETNKHVRHEGKKTYLYKLQNIKEILKQIDDDINVTNEKSINNLDTRIITFYTPGFIKNKQEILIKLAKAISKNSKVLIVELDEFNNYKGSVGMSNVIYSYKEKSLNVEIIRKEITNIKDQDFINSVTYPEDYNVISNIDLANIVNEFKKLDYKYIFINADSSFVKSQYVMNDSDMIILVKGKETENVTIFKNYIKRENIIDYKKLTEFDMEKANKAYIQAFIKQCFSKNYV